MIWFMIGGLYSILLITIGFYLGYKIMPQTIETRNQPIIKKIQTKEQQTSGAVKSMSALERSQESSKEIKERIEHLLS